MAGCAAPRHARDLRRGRSKANGGPQAARSAARPDQARHGPSATPCRMYEREALRARSGGKIPLRAPVAGRALRGAAAQLVAGWPPRRTPLPREAAWRGAPHPATRVFCGAGGPCTSAKRCAPDHAAKFRFAPQLPVGPCAGRLRRPALAALQKIRPPAPQITPLRALPRASRGAHGSGRRWGARSRFSRGAKRKPGGISRRASCCCCGVGSD